MNRALIVVLALLFTPTKGFAQDKDIAETWVTLRSSTGELLQGVVVTVVDSVGDPVERLVTDLHGKVVVTLRPMVSFRLSIDEPGYQSWSSPVLRADGDLQPTYEFELDPAPFALVGVTASVDRGCSAFGESARAVALFRAAQGVLASIARREENQDFRVQITRQRLDERPEGSPSGWLPARQSHLWVDSTVVWAPRPLAAPPADSLARLGYAVPDHAGRSTYHAPTAAVLSSHRFLRDHCIALREESSAKTVLAFEPRRDSLVEVRGEIELEPESNGPRLVRFQYTNLHDYLTEHELPLFRDEFMARVRRRNVSFGSIWIDDADFGGEIRFGGNGMVERWKLRVPTLVQFAFFSPTGVDVKPRAFGLETAGVVAEVRVRPTVFNLTRRWSHTLPSEYRLGGAVLTPLGRVLVWPSIGGRMLLLSADSVITVEAPEILSVLAAGFRETDETIFVIDAAQRTESAMTVEGRVLGTRTMPISGRLLAAHANQEGWAIETASDTAYRYYILPFGSGPAQVAMLPLDVTNEAILERGGTHHVRWCDGSICVARIGAPFTSWIIDPKSRVVTTGAFAPAELPDGGQHHAGMPLLALDSETYLRTMSDLTSDARFLLTLTPDGQIERTAELNAPIAFVDAAAGGPWLLGAFDAGGHTELVMYEWSVAR